MIGGSYDEERIKLVQKNIKWVFFVALLVNPLFLWWDYEAGILFKPLTLGFRALTELIFAVSLAIVWFKKPGKLGYYVVGSVCFTVSVVMLIVLRNLASHETAMFYDWGISFVILVTVLFIPFTLGEFLLFEVPVGVLYFISLLFFYKDSIDFTAGTLSVSAPLVVGAIATALLDKTRRAMSRYRARVDMLNRKLAEANERLEKSNRAMGDFLAICSHDLKNHLAAIHNAGELLQLYWTKLDEAKKGEYLESITYEASTMSKLIKDILDMAALDQGQFSVNKEPVRLKQLMESAARTAEMSGVLKHIDVIMEGGDDLGPVLVDPARLAQALDNLVSNAVRHSPERGTIFLRVKSWQDQWQAIEVEDQGEGVAEEERKKIFEPYVSGRSKGAVGLGLAIVKRLVELNGGRVDVETGRDGGALFRIILKSADREPGRDG